MDLPDLPQPESQELAARIRAGMERHCLLDRKSVV